MQIPKVCSYLSIEDHLSVQFQSRIQAAQCQKRVPALASIEDTNNLKNKRVIHSRLKTFHLRAEEIENSEIHFTLPMNYAEHVLKSM